MNLFGMKRASRPCIRCQTEPETVTVRQTQASGELLKDPNILPTKYEEKVVSM